MKKVFLYTLLTIFCVGAVNAFPGDVAFPQVNGLDGKIQKTKMIRQQNVAALQKDVLSAAVSAKNEIARLQEPNFSLALQSIVKVMDAYNALRRVSASAAAATSFEINAPFKAGWGAQLKMAEFVLRESVVLPESMQGEFDAWANQVLQDVASAVNAPAARETLEKLSSARRTINTMKTYNAGYVLQALAPVMDAHNALRKADPALAALVSREINKPIKAGFGGNGVVISRFVQMESVVVSGNLQYELDAWGAAMERDLK